MTKLDCFNQDTFVLVSKAPRPQKVPPPIELPPIRSNLSSDSTCWGWGEKGKSEKMGNSLCIYCLKNPVYMNTEHLER